MSQNVSDKVYTQRGNRAYLVALEERTINTGKALDLTAKTSYQLRGGK